MSCTPSTPIFIAPGAPSSRAWSTRLSQLIDAFARARRTAREQRELQQLDGRTFADLGMRRSEISSIVAEHCGAAAHTRLRVRP